MAARRSLMFGELARYYDALYAGKDYRGEVETLTRLSRRWGRSGGRRWLDVACGSGRHLELLRKGFTVEGVDASPEMLRRARVRVPGVPLHRADMRTFRLPGRFDVVSCLFSAIGHLPSEAAVGAAFANFARHLAPGGVVIVEPWIDPVEFRPGMVHLVTAREPGLQLARLAYSRRRGSRSLVEYHYLLGEAGRGVRHLHEVDRGTLVPRRRLVELMRRSGLSARFLRNGLPTGRGLVVGVKPRSSRRGSSGQRASSRGTTPRTSRNRARRPAKDAPGAVS